MAARHTVMLLWRTLLVAILFDMCAGQGQGQGQGQGEDIVEEVEIQSGVEIDDEERHTPLYRQLNIRDRVVLITGATAGIGEACAWRFAEAGSSMVLVARRPRLLQQLKIDIISRFPTSRIHTHVLDVQDTGSIAALPGLLPQGFKDVDILVNNAGLALGANSAVDTSIEDMQRMINTNVIGLMAMTSTFVRGMKLRSRGHLINIGSVSGHLTYAGGSVYCASKFAVNAYTQATRQDLVGTPVRVTAISPGMVETNFSGVRFNGDVSKAKDVYRDIIALEAADIADNVLYVATRPEHVQVADIIVWPTNQANFDVARVGASLGANPVTTAGPGV